MASFTDVTNEKKLKEEIYQLKKEIEQLHEMNSIFKMFFDTTDVVMGAVELVDNDTGCFQS